jgi:hypothetical protein
MTANETDLDAVRTFVEILDHVKAKRAEYKDQMKGLDALEKTAIAAVQEHLGDNETGNLDGRPAITWKRTKRTALSQSILKRDFPEAAAACMEITEVRRFVVADREDA